MARRKRQLYQKKSGSMCAYCRRTMQGKSDGLNDLAPTFDHYMPKAKGGTGCKSNLVACCVACNAIKGNMTPVEWIKFMANTPEWWKEWSPSKKTASKLAARSVMR